MNSESERIYLSPPHLTGGELARLQEVLQSNWIAPVGPEIERFETAISKVTGANHILALNSCTSALHLALRLLNVGKGDIVLVQSHTFIASVHSVAYTGAEPVFIDSESHSWNMDPEALFVALENLKSQGKLDKVKAIMLVHSYGIPAQIDRIMEIANNFDVPIIEDAAESMGSKWNGQHTGTFGLYGAFSFNGNKIITCGGGGALVCPNTDSRNNALFLSTQAKDEIINPLNGSTGFNYRLSNILAGVGSAQIEALPDRVLGRVRIFEKYKDYFGTWSQKGLHIDFQNEWEGSESNRWMSNVLFENSTIRNQVLKILNAANIESRLLRKPMHLQMAYDDSRIYGASGPLNSNRQKAISADLYERGLSLPSGTSLTDSQFARILEALDQALKEL